MFSLNAPNEYIDEVYLELNISHPYDSTVNVPEITNDPEATMLLL